MDRTRFPTITGLTTICCLLSTPSWGDPSAESHIFGQAHDLELMTPHSVAQTIALARFLDPRGVRSQRPAPKAVDHLSNPRLGPTNELLEKLRASSRALRVAERLLSGDRGFGLRVDPGDKEIQLMWRTRLR